MNTSYMSAQLSQLTFIHASKESIVHLESTSQFFARPNKPCGLWLSHDNGFNWKSWCEQEQFPYGAHEYAVTIDSSANIACLDSLLSVETFFQQFSLGDFSINWEEVAKNYDGIYVAAHVISLAFDFDCAAFLYGWDLTSMCIWNADAVKTFEKI